MQKFSWPAYPSTHDDFEALMLAIDSALAASDVKPHQRPHHVGFKLWEAFGWGGNALPPDHLADQPGFEGDVLLAKAFRWYDETLGRRLTVSMDIGHVPVSLGRTVWRLRIIEWFGSVNFFLNRNLSNKGSEGIQGQVLPSVNVLTLVDDLPQGAVDRLTNEELESFFRFYQFAMRSLEWRNNLPPTPLLRLAKGDYDSSSNEIFAHRYPQARWAAQQAIEKTIKGLLAMAGDKFPVGRDGHDLLKLSKQLSENHGVHIDSEIITPAHCSTGVRYEDIPSTQAEAVSANHAALRSFEAIKNSQGILALMSKYRS